MYIIGELVVDAYKFKNLYKTVRSVIPTSLKPPKLSIYNLEATPPIANLGWKAWPSLTKTIQKYSNT